MTGEAVSHVTTPRTVADALNQLFSIVYKNSQPPRPWPNSEVVRSCREAGYRLSEAHLSELRRGLKTNPSLRTLSGIAWFFDVPVGYFTDHKRADEISAVLLRSHREHQDAWRNWVRVAQRVDKELDGRHRRRRAHTTAPCDLTPVYERTALMRSLAQLIKDDPSPTPAVLRQRKALADQVLATLEQE